MKKKKKMGERVGCCREDDNESRKWEKYGCWVINIENNLKTLIGETQWLFEFGLAAHLDGLDGAIKV